MYDLGLRAVRAATILQGMTTQTTNPTKLTRIPSSETEPMWRTVNGRFLVMAHRHYVRRSTGYSKTFSVFAEGPEGRIEIGETRTLANAKVMIAEHVELEGETDCALAACGLAKATNK